MLGGDPEAQAQGPARGKEEKGRERSNMTLDTAKKIKEENYAHIVEMGKLMGIAASEVKREVDAVIRGGFYHCEIKEGKREYIYLKVKPTENDMESSINNAIASYQNRNRRPKKIIEEKKIETVAPASPTPAIKHNEPQEVTKLKQVSTLPKLKNYLKNRIQVIMKVLDSIVQE